MTPVRTQVEELVHQVAAALERPAWSVSLIHKGSKLSEGSRVTLDEGGEAARFPQVMLDPFTFCLHSGFARDAQATCAGRFHRLRGIGSAERQEALGGRFIG